MFDAPLIALSCAVLVSSAAAFTDGRFGTIPNSVTLPPVFLAPAIYAAVGGSQALLASLAALALSSVVPYALFRARAMGGGDVKLFAAIGAITGYDPLVGLWIQLVAFIVATVGLFAVHAIQRRLLATLRRAARQTRETICGRQRVLHRRDETGVRLGGFVFAATLLRIASPLLGGVAP
jgi:prepilin peptidase CpaA